MYPCSSCPTGNQWVLANSYVIPSESRPLGWSPRLPSDSGGFCWRARLHQFRAVVANVAHPCIHRMVVQSVGW